MPGLSVSRRAWLGGSAASVLFAMLRDVSIAQTAGTAAPDLIKGNPFTLGVASGEPWPTSVVLWTKLAPDIMDPGLLGRRTFEVSWEVFADDKLTKAVRSGTTIARPELGHAVHVEVAGLEPGRSYWYRFRHGREASAIGRAVTAPPADASPERLRFAFASCAEFEEAGYEAYAAMAEDDLDFIVHLGDYIYEVTYETPCLVGPKTPEDVEKKRFKKVRCLNLRGQVRTLDDYRIRYGEHRADPMLQRAHAHAPWIVTWDDHEVENDYAGLLPQRIHERDPEVLAEFARLRRAAYQAYFEMMPLRALSRPKADGSLQLYRRFDFGRLLRLHVLDERQYRSPQACRAQRNRHEAAKDTSVWRSGAYRPELCPEHESRERTMLGKAQEQWLEQGCLTSPAQWNVVAQGVMVADIDVRAHERVAAQYQRFVYNDMWQGYPVAQRRLVDLLARTRNPLVLSGDLHAFFANQLNADGRAGERPVAPEFVVGAVSSWIARNAQLAPVAFDPINAATVRYANLGFWHGYGLATVSAKEAEVVYRGFPHAEGTAIKDWKSARVDLASFRVGAGTRRLKVESVDPVTCVAPPAAGPTCQARKG